MTHDSSLPTRWIAVLCVGLAAGCSAESQPESEPDRGEIVFETMYDGPLTYPEELEMNDDLHFMTTRSVYRVTDGQAHLVATDFLFPYYWSSGQENGFLADGGGFKILQNSGFVSIEPSGKLVEHEGTSDLVFTIAQNDQATFAMGEDQLHRYSNGTWTVLFDRMKNGDWPPPNSELAAMTADEESVYFCDRLLRCFDMPQAGGEARQLGQFEPKADAYPRFPFDLIEHGEDLFFVAEVDWRSEGRPYRSVLLQLPKTGGDFRVVKSYNKLTDRPDAIAVADGNLYSVSSGGVWRIELDSGRTKKLAARPFENDVGSGLGFYSIALDDQYVYWLDEERPDSPSTWPIWIRRTPR